MADDVKKTWIKFKGWPDHPDRTYRRPDMRGALKPGDVAELPDDVVQSILGDHGDAFEKTTKPRGR